MQWKLVMTATLDTPLVPVPILPICVLCVVLLRKWSYEQNPDLILIGNVCVKGVLMSHCHKCAVLDVGSIPIVLMTWCL